MDKKTRNANFISLAPLLIIDRAKIVIIYPTLSYKQETTRISLITSRLYADNLATKVGVPPLFEGNREPKAFSGGGYSIVGEPLTVEDEYAAVWKRGRLDTNELARLRFSDGWTVQKLVEHFGYSRTAIKNNLRWLSK